MESAENNIHSSDKLEFSFHKVSNLILFCYNEIIKNERIEYTKIKDKYCVVTQEGNIKPECYIRNIFLDKKYILNKDLKRRFEVNNLEFKSEVGETKSRKTIGFHDIQVTGISLENTGEADEDIYFSIECKRLNNSLQSPTKYISDGIIRYVFGQYSEKMPIAAMMGFIEDDLNDYPFEINELLKSHKTIKTVQYLILSKNHTNKYSSIHNREENNDIKLYHFLLDFKNIITKKE